MVPEPRNEGGFKIFHVTINSMEEKRWLVLFATDISTRLDLAARKRPMEVSSEGSVLVFRTAPHCTGGP